MLPFYEFMAIGLMLGFILALFTGFPVAWLLGGLSLIFAALGIYLGEFGFDTFLMTNWMKVYGVTDRLDAIMSNWVLVSLPMFVYMGLMLDKSGVADLMMKNFVKVFGGIRGGLGLTVVGIGILLAASTGIVGASVVLLAMLAMPVMLENRYSKGMASGVVAASGTLGILIPPSIMLVLMADQASVSVGDLFMGALIPGVLLGLLYMVFIVGVGIFRPDLVPPRDTAGEAPPGWREIGMAFLSTIPTFGLILVVLGSIFFGIATPTEASGLGAAGAILLAAANRKLSWKVMREVGIETTLTTCFIFAIFIGATMFAYILRLIGGDELIAEFFKGLGLGESGLVAVVLLVVFVAGFFLDWFEIVLIILPLLAPVIKELGIDMTWFLILVALMLQTSFLTPPVGFSLFYLKGVVPPGVTIRDIYVGVIPFVILQLTMVAAAFYFPQLITWLPEQMYGSPK